MNDEEAQKVLLPAERVLIGAEDNIRYSVIWLHGLGADGNDFKPIIPELAIESKYSIRFIFPHAPVRPVTVNNGYKMRAWYDIKGSQLGKGGVEELTDIHHSVKQIQAFVDAEIMLGIAPQHIFLVGFSQGGVIALHTGLSQTKPLAGVAALSTYLPFAPTLLKSMNEGVKVMPIFAAHGDHDEVIPIAAWHDYTKALTEVGMKHLSIAHYPMAHSVSIEEIKRLGEWFNQTIQLDSHQKVFHAK